jgi:hypothetical protein
VKNFKKADPVRWRPNPAAPELRGQFVQYGVSRCPAFAIVDLGDGRQAVVSVRLLRAG